MKKVVKIVLWLLGGIVVLVVAAVAALPLWFGPVVKTAANAMVPGMVKTDFRLGHLSLNPYTARFELGDLNLANPKGYAAKDAVRVGSMIFDAETMSLATDVIHIEEVTLRDLFVSVVSGGENKVLNFKQIQYNVAGGKDKYEAARSEKEAQSAAAQDNPPAAEKPAAEKPAKKIIIDRLEVAGLTIQLSVLPLKVPSIVLTDIGRKSGGATLEEVWNQIRDGIMKATGLTSDQLKMVGLLTGDATKKASEAVNKAAAQATAVVDSATKQLSAQSAQATAAVDSASKQLSAQTEKATAALDGVTKALSSKAGTSVGSTDGVTKALSETTGKATGKTAEVMNEGMKAVNEGTKAVGEGAKKALDSLKSLW